MAACCELHYDVDVAVVFKMRENLDYIRMIQFVHNSDFSLQLLHELFLHHQRLRYHFNCIYFSAWTSLRGLVFHLVNLAKGAFSDSCLRQTDKVVNADFSLRAAGDCGSLKQHSGLNTAYSGRPSASHYMVDLEPRLRRLKEIFPAGERPVLLEAAKSPTLELAVKQLANIYGTPSTKPSAWASPPNLSQPPSVTRTQALTRAVGDSQPTDIFMVETYKTKPCTNKAGCTCDKYHHEFERRRDPARYHYSEIPCQHVFAEGQWRAAGLCKVGDKCTFAHSVNEASFHPRMYKTRNCNHFDNGSCHFGSRCAYIHGREDSVAAAWRRRVEQRNMANQQAERSTESRGVSLGNFIPKHLVPEEQKSSLRASAWEFTPAGKSPLELLNSKLQSRVEELYLKTLCSICFNNEKNCALVPCGHLFCKQCMEQTMRAQCPICRKDIVDRLEVFF